MEDEVKLMKKVIDSVVQSWPKLSPAGRVYVKSRLESLDVDAPVLTDEEKERN